MKKKIIKTFESYIDDTLNKAAIDSAAVIEFTDQSGNHYQHLLQFVLPYHENDLMSKRDYNVGAWDMTDYKFKFDEFEKDYGSIRNGGLVKRTIFTSGIVYDGVLYRNDQYNLLEYRHKSKRENKPLYVLKFVTIKNGQVAYSERGLELMKEKYPEFIYKT